MNVGFKGLLNAEATFDTITPAESGQLVKVTGNGIVTKAVDEEFSGIVTKAEDSFVSVQLKGYIEMKYTGDAPAHGIVNLKAGSNANEITVAKTGGVTVTVVYVNTTDSIVGFIL